MRQVIIVEIPERQDPAAVLACVKRVLPGTLGESARLEDAPADIRALAKRIQDVRSEASLIASQVAASRGPRGGMPVFWKGAESAVRAILRRLEENPFAKGGSDAK